MMPASSKREAHKPGAADLGRPQPRSQCLLAFRFVTAWRCAVSDVGRFCSDLFVTFLCIFTPIILEVGSSKDPLSLVLTRLSRKGAFNHAV